MAYPLREPGPVSLRRLFLSASFVGCTDIVVSAATECSRHVTPGCLFAALPGTKVHGRTFVADALRSGAAAVLTDRPLAELPLPQCIVSDPRRAYAELCQALHGFPSRQLGLVGVTGTNGKTTTTWLIRSILEHCGRSAGIIGTIEYNDGVDAVPAHLTTPDSLTLARWLRGMHGRGTAHAAIELSSHALHQERAAGITLDAAVITNVTQDHLDYHPDFERYLQAKARIVHLLKSSGILIVNADDPGSRRIGERTPMPIPRATFSIDGQADVTAQILSHSPQGTHFVIRANQSLQDCFTPLIGRHNVENCLAATAALIHLGLPLEQIAAGIAACPSVPGRLQRIPGADQFQVFVDYAHTPDALARAIGAVRPITSGRVLIVFGAGGDRDRSKRPAMGQAAARADLCILTSDNPRSENPLTIIDDVAAGFAATTNFHIEPNRRRAIEWALQQAAPGDSVIIAGKGHERTQIIAGQALPFDDAAVCRDWLARQHATFGHEPHFLHSARFVPLAEFPGVGR